MAGDPERNGIPGFLSVFLYIRLQPFSVDFL